MPNTVEFEAMRQRVLACKESNERDAVLANLEAGVYERAGDFDKDVAWVELIDKRRSELDKLHAEQSAKE